MRKTHKTNITCEDIFPISAIYPQQTFIDRRDFTKQILDTLKSGQIALVYGMSKSGKTLLVEYTLNRVEMARLWLYGNQLSDESAVWMILAAKLHIKTVSPRSVAKEQTNIIEQLKRHNHCVVVDDFHYIPTQETRIGILRFLKMLNGEGVPVIIIGVQSPHIREIELLQDMMGRVKAIPLDGWTIEELTRIASKGFNSRGSAVIQLQRLAQESFGSPFLMQLFCQLYCKHRLEKKLGSEIGYIEKIELADLEVIFPQAANSVLYTHVYELLTHPVACLNNQLFTRHDGKKGNFNQMFWYSISGVYPIGAMPYLRSHLAHLQLRLRQVFHPSEKEISSEIFFEYVAYMVDYYYSYYNKTYETFSRHDPIIDLIGQVFYVRDPFILFYLRHSSEVEKQFIGY